MSLTNNLQPTHEAIAELAFIYWLKDGYVHGRDKQHWLDAESTLKQQIAVNQETQVKSQPPADYTKVTRGAQSLKVTHPVKNKKQKRHH